MTTTSVTKVSPNYDSNSFGSTPSFEDHVELFRDRVEGWQLDIARHLLANVPDSGYAALSVLASYFEMAEQHATGESSNRRSKEFFGSGFRRVYPRTHLSDSEIDKVYGHVRNGMYHDGFTKLDTLVSEKLPKAVDIDGGVVLVNPHELEADIRAHFEAYVAELRDPDSVDAREKFERLRSVTYGT